MLIHQWNLIPLPLVQMLKCLLFLTWPAWRRHVTFGDLWSVFVCLHSFNHDGVCVLLRHSRCFSHAVWSDNHLPSIPRCTFIHTVNESDIDYWKWRLTVTSSVYNQAFCASVFPISMQMCIHWSARMIFLRIISILAFSSEYFWITFDLHAGCTCFRCFFIFLFF